MEKQSTRKFLKLFVALVALFLLGSSALLLSSCKEEHTHDWGEGTVSVQPTCTAQGLKTFECSCGAVRTEPIQATGHKWEQEGEPVEPTCKDEGYTLYKCSVCGETEQRDVKPTTKHDFQLVEEVAPTCTKDGAEVYECSYCGTVYQKTIAASGEHEYDKEHPYLVVEANCIAGGYIQYRCTKCGEIWTDPTSYTPIGTHNYQVVEDESHPATCTESGLKIYECEFCGDRYTDSQYTADNPATGHKWSANTNEKDLLEGATTNSVGQIVITVGTETYTYDNVAAAKAALAGWTTKTAANCTEKGEMIRTCSVCGETESAELNALGHYVTGMTADKTLDEVLAEAEKAVCVADPNLIAADGTANYAFICERENCPCNVVIDAIGTTAHYVPVVDHTYVGADGKEVEWTTKKAVSCEADGVEHRFCQRKACNHEDTRVVKSTGHVWNEKQLSGLVDAIVCSPDPDLNGDKEDVTKAVAKVLRAMFPDDLEYAAAHDKMVEKYDAFVKANPTAQISRFCTVCFDFEAAKEHSWIVSALQDGKYGLNDYVTDEEGNPVDSGLTLENMNCRYVQVCEHCKTVARRGDHPAGSKTPASCRDYGRCTVCGEVTADIEEHLYYNIATIKKNAEASQTANTKVNSDEDFTWKELYAAYEKVVATEGWMAPTDGSCDTPGQKVVVCVKCLMDASEGEEIAWTENTHAVGANEALPTDGSNNTVYYAYTESFEAAHKYETVYFNLKAKDTNDTANMIKSGKDGTNCEFGFKVAYICSECNDIYRNQPTSDNTATGDKNEAANNKYQDISLNGEDKKGEFTDANGFILDLTESAAQAQRFDATSVKVDNNKGAHSIYVPVDYKTLAGQYKAPNCAEYAQLPVVCEKCGATLQYTVEDLKDQANHTNEFTFAETVDEEEGIKLDTTNVFAEGGALAKEAAYNENNHAGTPFDCGEHCNYAVKSSDGTKYTAWCHAFGDTNTSVDADKLEKAYHATVEVTIKLSSSVKYTDGYTLHVATVTEESIVAPSGDVTNYSVDWTKATITDTDKASKCSGSADKLNQYTLPVSYVESEAEIKEGTKYLVVKDAAGKYYGLSDILFYNNTDYDGEGSTPVSGTITVTEDDTFFVRFEGSEGIPGVAVKADSAEALSYAVEKNPTTTEGTGANAKTVLNITITNDISVTDIPNIQDRPDAANIDKVTYDLGGKKLSTSQTTTYAWDADANSGKGEGTFTGYEVVFKNGTIEFTSEKVGASKALLAPIDDAALTLDGVTLTTKSGTAILAQQGSEESTTVPTVTIKNSTLNVGGAFGVSTNASYSTADTSAVVVTIENSTITMNPENKTGNAATDNTALFINVPAKVSVKNSTLSANRQVVVARGGQTVIENSELILREGYVSPETWVDEDGYIKQDQFESVKGDRTIASIKEWRPYMTQQNFRLAGIWDQGNELPQGVLVMGNSNTTAYKYTTSVDVTKDVTFTNNTSMPNIVIGSYHSAEIMGNADDGYKVAVTLKTPAGFTGISYCSNWVEGTVNVNGKVVTK